MALPDLEEQEDDGDVKALALLGITSKHPAVEESNSEAEKVADALEENFERYDKLVKLHNAEKSEDSTM